MQQKNKDELLSILINLAASAELKELTPEDHLNSCFRYVDGFNPTLVWHGEHKVKQFDEAITFFWTTDSEIHQTISKKTIKTKIDNLILNAYKTEKPINRRGNAREISGFGNGREYNQKNPQPLSRLFHGKTPWPRAKFQAASLATRSRLLCK